MMEVLMEQKNLAVSGAKKTKSVFVILNKRTKVSMWQ